MSLFAKFVGTLPPSLVGRVSSARYRHPWLRGPIEWVARRLHHRDGVVSRGPARGLLFNPGPTSAFCMMGNAEPDLQKAMVALLKPGMTFFDLGANSGFVGMLGARLVGPTGKVVCVEALPEIAKLIVNNARLNGFEGFLDLRRGDRRG